MLKIFSFIIFISFTLLNAQEFENTLSGSLKNDTHFVLQNLADSSVNFNIDIQQKKKTPILAALMSFAVPGAGEVYTENYLKAGIFLAIEIAGIVTSVTYNQKGDDQTEFFEDYANEHWSVARYANWTYANLSTLNPELDQANYNLYDGNGNINWNELNEMESDIGSYYSHHFAPFGDQQYYEMIGKYSQFNVGWDEFGDDPNKSYVYGDELVDQFHWYSKERGQANDYYTVAKWAVIAVVSNHFISAIDAAWSASRYNKNLKFEISVEEQNIGYYKEYYPQLNLSYNF